MNAKKLAAEKAVTFVKGGMIIGLGTGSTASFAIEAIGKLVNQGLSIKAVASSIRSEDLAKTHGIPLISFSEIKTIDIYIDGADEVDQQLNLIKGGGGALLREKIVAFNSKEFIVIVDSSKQVDHLGKFPLPVEVTDFGHELTRKHLEKLGCVTTIRQANNKPYKTDNGNLIIDCEFAKITEVEELNHRMEEIPGIVENGLFSKRMVSKLIVGYENGEVRIRESEQ